MSKCGPSGLERLIRGAAALALWCVCGLCCQPAACEVRRLEAAGSAQRAVHLAEAAPRMKEVKSEKAIETIERSDWYDKRAHDFAPPDDLADPDSSLRRSGWISKPKVPDASAATPATANRRWFNWLSGLDLELLNYITIATLGALLLTAALALSYWSMRNWLPGRFRKRDDVSATPIDMAKVVDLPFEVKPTGQDPLSEAECLMREGRFNEAIVFLFGYVLLALDQADTIRLRRGKTNRMYLRELVGHKQLRSFTERAMIAFEDVFFGRYSLSRERYLEIWNQMPAFHAWIQPQDSSRLPDKATTS